MSSLEDTTQKMPKNYFISDTLACKWQSRELSNKFKILLIRRHSILSPPKLSLFLHVAFYTTGSCGRILMSSSWMRRTWRRTTLNMAMVLLRVLVRLGRTRGRSWLTQCGQIEAQPGSEERRTTNLQEHYHAVQHSSAPRYLCPKHHFASS
jgi:hypothetical protein